VDDTALYGTDLTIVSVLVWREWGKSRKPCSG